MTVGRPISPGVRLPSCPEDQVYLILENGKILWNERAAVMIETQMKVNSFEYWIAKHLWAYEGYLRSLN